MDQTLKDLLQEKLDGLPAADAAPGFDRAQTWTEIAGRLAPPKRRTLPFRPHWGYAAAALLAGLLLGGPVLKYLQPDAAPAPAVTATDTPRTKPAALPVVPAPPAPVVAGTRNRSVAAPAPASGATPVRGNRMVAAPVREAVPQTPVPEPKPLDRPQPAPAPVAAARTPRRAVHLLDLQTDDRTVLLDDGPAVRPSTGFTLYLSPKRLPDGRDDGAPSSVIRPLLR